MTFSFSAQQLRAKPAATTTTLATTSGGKTITSGGSVASGSVVTLTAAVNGGGTAVKTGQVNFCDASAKSCSDIHLLGMAQLTSAGTATLKLRPAIGSHHYKAVFSGTNTYVGSSSSATSLTVTGTADTFASTTTIAETGSWGQYTLSATVTESGSTVSPTGAVSFLDTSNGNAVLDQIVLGPSVAGIDWPSRLGLTLPTNSPQAAAVGDFNGDGIPDLVLSAGGPSQRLVIFLGNANGTYTTVPGPSIFTYSFGPIVSADFNGDGKQDMAVLNANSSAVTILLGNGDGTFTVSASSPATGSSPNQLAMGDFNGDGIPDLAVTEDSTNTVLIFLGNGDGTFTAAPNLVAGSSPYAIAVGDFNGDGKMDMAVTDTYDDTVSVLLGKGDGTFAAATSLHCGSNGSPIAAGDFSGNGKLDLAVAVKGATGQSDSLTILVGKGDGTFTSPQSGQVVSSNAVSAMQVGDFNGDGIPDLVLTDSNTGAFTVFLGNGKDSFTATEPTLAGSPDFGLSSAVGDLNGDGRTDMVVGVFGSDTALVYLTEPTETATVTANVSLASVGQHLVDASYGGDGNFNPSVSGKTPLWGVPPSTATTLTMSSGRAQVTSVPPGSVVTLTATVKARTNPVATGQVSFCDASASQCTDIHLLGTVALTSGGTAIFKFVPGAGMHSYKAVFMQDGYGLNSSSSALTLTVGPAPSVVYSDTEAISATGYPGDYSLTATVVGYGGSAPPTGNVSFLDTSFGNKALATAPLGPSTAGLGWLISQTPAASSNPISELTGDFNGDGIPDLALLGTSNIYNDPPFSITILFGKGDGTFTSGPTTQVPASATVVHMMAGDFNGDGKEDIVLLTDFLYPPGATVITFLGDGNGMFTVSTASNVVLPPQDGGDVIQPSMVVADFNGDGKLDLAMVGNYIYGGVAILLGNGDGTFTATATNSEANRGLGMIGVGDFNGDGIPDLVVSDFFSPSTTTVLLGKGDGTFITTEASLSTDTFARSAVTGDFNGDGKIDLAIGFNGAVGVYLGNGDGSFTQPSGSPFSGSGLELHVGDFNHDGKLDLASIDDYSNTVTLLLGAGDGTFTSVPTSSGGSLPSGTPVDLVSGDFNQDGVTDLSFVTRYRSTASILLTEQAETATATVNGIAPVGVGTHNVEAKYQGDSNYRSVVSGTVALTAGMAPVVISPAGGTYSSVQTITISESVPGATIYYSAYGVFNTAGFVPYTGPISINMGGVETITAYATETGYQQSNYTTASFTLNLPPAPTPVILPAAGSFPGSQMVTISDAAANATIYYTTDGTYPTIFSKVYTGPITVSTSETVAAIATASGYGQSGMAIAEYFIDSSQSSFVYTVAGNENWGYEGDGGLATAASLNYPAGIAMDSSGNMYIADSGNNVVRKVAAGTGIITTVAGTGVAGYNGDSGPATNAQLWDPSGVAVDVAGNLYIADSLNKVVRVVAADTGTITTYAGSATATSVGDNGPANKALLSNPIGLAFGSGGDLYISDLLRVRKVSAKTGIITTDAGSGQYGYTGDTGPATSATLGSAEGLALDSAGNLYIADAGNGAIRKVTANTGVITTVAGKGASRNGPFFSGDGGPATSAQLSSPYGVAVDSSGNIYIADTYNLAVRKVTASNGIINTILGHPPSTCLTVSGDGGPAINSATCNPAGLMLDSSGNLYVAESTNQRIRKVTMPMLPPTKATAAPVFNAPGGTYSGPQTVSITDATPGAAIYLTVNGNAPTTAGVGYRGTINVTGSSTLQAVAVAPGYLPSAPVTAAYTITTPPTAVISTVAGNGVYGGSGAGGPAISAELRSPNGVGLDGVGNLYIADNYNNVVWKVAAGTGTINPAAGTATLFGGNLGNGGPATGASLNSPTHVAFDSAGNLYIADSGNNEIRKVAAQTGIISLYAGGGNYSTNLGDGGPATAAILSNPEGLAFDSAGSLYIADQQNSRIRMVSATTGNISTVAGGATNGILGDGGQAISATLFDPIDVAVDSKGNLYIADMYDERVRIVNASTGVISTLVGNGDGGESGDGGPATAAEVYPLGLALDGTGNLYISSWPDAVRMVPTGGGTIVTVAGSGYRGFGGDGGSATMAEFCLVQGLAFDKAGSLYIADQCNYRVRKVTYPGPAATPSFSLPAGSYTGTQKVTITDATQGAVIYYTTNGATPTIASTKYTAPIAVVATETIKAVAVATGYTASPIASASYTIQQELKIALSPANLTFASTVVGANSSAQVVKVMNTGTGTVTLDATSVTGANPKSFITSATTCGTTLAAGASCTTSIEFKPTVTGALSASLAIADNASGSPQLVALKGTAVPVLTVSVSPASLAFAPTTVGAATAAKLVTLKNTSTAALTLGTPSFTGADPKSFIKSATTCGTSLAAGASCSMSVEFKPAVVGSLSASLAITDNASGSPQPVALTGTAVLSLTIAVSPAILTFASTVVGAATAPQIVTAKNTGTATVTLGATSFTGANPKSFIKSATTCGTSLAAGASCTVSIEFKPAVVGSLSASLAITDNASGSPQLVALKGTATAASALTVSLSPKSWTPASTLFGAAIALPIVAIR